MPRSKPENVEVAEADGTLDTEELVQRFRLAVGRLSRRLNYQTKRELTLSQWSALATTARRGPMRLGALAAHENVSPSVLSRLVADLEAGGLVQRRADPEDARASLLTATAAGQRRLAAVRAASSELLEGLLAELSDRQRDALTNALPVLETLADRLARQAENASAPR